MILYMVKERNHISLMNICLVRKQDVLKTHGDFIVWCNQLYVNNQSELRKLEPTFAPGATIEKVAKRDDWIFAQDGPPSHQLPLVQDLLKTKLKRHLIRAEEWPPSSPDVNPLGYFIETLLKP